MSRIATGLAVLLLLAVSISSLITLVQADEPTVVLPARGDRVAPSCLSTAEVLAEGPAGTELQFTFEWDPDISEGVPAGRLVTVEPVRASYRRADMAGAPLGGRIWQASSSEPGTYSAFVRVPDRGAVEMDILSFELVSPDGTPVDGYERADIARCLAVSEPAIMRDLRLVTVTFDPALDQPPLDALVRSVSVSVRATASNGVNEKTVTQHPVLAGVRAPLRVGGHQLRRAAVEARCPGLRPAAHGAPLLVVTSDSMVPALEPLIEWKDSKGMPSRSRRSRPSVRRRADIKAYMHDRIRHLGVPPEYLLLVGDTEVLPAYYRTRCDRQLLRGARRKRPLPGDHGRAVLR